MTESFLSLRRHKKRADDCSFRHRALFPIACSFHSRPAARYNSMAGSRDFHAIELNTTAFDSTFEYRYLKTVSGFRWRPLHPAFDPVYWNVSVTWLVNIHLHLRFGRGYLPSCSYVIPPLSRIITMPMTATVIRYAVILHLAIRVGSYPFRVPTSGAECWLRIVFAV